MDADEKLIADRVKIDERAFLINALDPERAPRLSLAVNAIRAALLMPGWHRHSALVAAGLRASDLAVTTTTNIIYRAVKVGMVEKRGEYTQKRRGRPASDTRQYRLIEWPCSLDEK